MKTISFISVNYVARGLGYHTTGGWGQGDRATNDAFRPLETFGQGVVPIEGCVQTLQKMGYGGAISIEHQPEEFDPTEDCMADLEMLRGWLAS